MNPFGSSMPAKVSGSISSQPEVPHGQDPAQYQAVSAFVSDVSRRLAAIGIKNVTIGFSAYRSGDFGHHAPVTLENVGQRGAEVREVVQAALQEHQACLDAVDGVRLSFFEGSRDAVKGGGPPSYDHNDFLSLEETHQLLTDRRWDELGTRVDHVGMQKLVTPQSKWGSLGGSDGGTPTKQDNLGLEHGVPSLDDLALLMGPSDDAPRPPAERFAMTLDFNGLGVARHEDDSVLTQVANLRGDIEAAQKETPTLARIPTEELMAIRGYTMSGYVMLNATLREPVRLASTLEKYQSYIDAAVSGLGKLPAVQGQVFRGTDLTADQLRPYVQGATIVDPAFMSTTTERGEADGTAPGGGFKGNVLFVITSSTGRDVSGFAHDKSEHEVIFAPGTRFHVDSVDDSKKPIVITLTEM